MDTHDQAYLVFNYTLEQVHQRWYWSGMTDGVCRFVFYSQACQQATAVSHQTSKKDI